MKKGKLFQRACTSVFMFIGLAQAAHAIDFASLEWGEGNQTQMVRIGTQWRWDQQWWHSNGTHLGGYWDFTLAHWRGQRFQDRANASQHLNDIGITPVLRFQRDHLKGLYAELGIGAHYLSGLYDNSGRKLSTRFQFGDHIGVGYAFSNNVDLGLKFQHFSNGSLKKPNDGVNFLLIRLSFPI